MTHADLMTSHPAAHDPGWHTLAEFTLLNDPGDDYWATVYVVEAVQQLNLPAVRLERLERAMAQATFSALERRSKHCAELPLSIRVLVSEPASRLAGLKSDGASLEPGRPDAAAHSWGFFLVEKLVDCTAAVGDPSRHVIELFVYLEGDSRPRLTL